MTRPGRHLVGLIEAAGLTAVLVVPLFFNTYSQRVFEPDKAAILRSLGVLIAGLSGAYLLIGARAGKRREAVLLPVASPRRFPLLLPAGCYLLSVIVSTFFSLVPSISFSGSYDRLQGAYTTLGYFALFLGFAYCLRGREQEERVVNVLIASSLPICIYAVFQRFGLDPLDWSKDVSRRVTGTLGNPIFLGAYLVLIIPLTLYRTGARLRRRWGNPDSRTLASTIFLSLVVGLQVLALYLSSSRGPGLAWAASLYVMAAVSAAARNRKWTARAVIVLPLLAMAGLVFLRGDIGFDRTKASARAGLSRFVNPESGSSTVRVLIWEGAGQLFAPHEPFIDAKGYEDRLNLVRPLIGYGPETLLMVFTRYYSPDLGRLQGRGQFADRAHNATWDALIERGLLGFAAYLGIYLAVFRHCLGRLGLIGGRLEARRFWLLVLLGLVFGCVSAFRLGGVAFIGIGIPAGIIGGILLYLFASTWFQGGRDSGEAVDGLEKSLVICLLGSVCAHFVEIQFGIGTTPSRTAFWALLALLAASGSRRFRHTSKHSLNPGSVRKVAEPPEGGGSGRCRVPEEGCDVSGRDRRAADFFWGLVAAAALCTLVFGFVTNPSLDAERNGILAKAMFGKTGLLLGIVWVSLAAFAAAVRRGGAGPRGVRSFVFRQVLPAGAIVVLFTFVLAEKQAYLVRHVPADAGELLANTRCFEGLLTCFFLFVAIFVCLLAAANAGTRWGALKIPGKEAAVIAAVFLGIAAPVAVETNLKPIQSNMTLKTADSFLRLKRWVDASLLFHRAIHLDPGCDQNYFAMADSLQRQATAARDPSMRAKLIEEAVHLARQAQHINPLKSEHMANLGRLYLWWASITQEAVQRRVRGDLADYYFGRALRLSPNQVQLWCQRAQVSYSILNRVGPVLGYLNRALEVDPRYPLTHQMLGDHFARVAWGEKDPERRRKAFAKAATSFERAFDLAKREKLDNIYQMRISAGEVYEQLGDIGAAVRHAREALEIAPEGDRPGLSRLIEALESRLDRNDE